MSGNGKDERPVAFHDVPASALPITMEIFGPGMVPLWSTVVTDACMIEIPGYGPGNAPYVRMTDGHGNVDTLFACPKCERVSHHPKDFEHGYCGACHEFTG